MSQIDINEVRRGMKAGELVKILEKAGFTLSNTTRHALIFTHPGTDSHITVGNGKKDMVGHATAVEAKQAIGDALYFNQYSERYDKDGYTQEVAVAAR